jgi:hypothetical protein
VSRGLWGERADPQWHDIVFLDASGPCNVVRSRRDHVTPGEPLFTERVSGTAPTMLHRCVQLAAHLCPAGRWLSIG